jgi:hypothetical protein
MIRDSFWISNAIIINGHPQIHCISRCAMLAPYMHQELKLHVHVLLTLHKQSPAPFCCLSLSDPWIVSSPRGHYHINHMRLEPPQTTLPDSSPSLTDQGCIYTHRTVGLSQINTEPVPKNAVHVTKFMQPTCCWTDTRATLHNTMYVCITQYHSALLKATVSGFCQLCSHASE